MPAFNEEKIGKKSMKPPPAQSQTRKEVREIRLDAAVIRRISHLFSN